MSKLNFLGLLQIIDEKTMIRLMGKDLTMYLKFLKFQAVQFFIIFILSFSTMIPLYWTGSDAKRYFTVTSSGNSTATNSSSNETSN